MWKVRVRGGRWGGGIMKEDLGEKARVLNNGEKT